MKFQKIQTIQLALLLRDSCSLPQFIHVRQDRNNVTSVLMWESLHSCPNPVCPYCLTPIGVNVKLSQLYMLNFNQRIDEDFFNMLVCFLEKGSSHPCALSDLDGGFVLIEQTGFKPMQDKINLKTSCKVPASVRRSRRVLVV